MLPQLCHADKYNLTCGCPADLEERQESLSLNSCCYTCNDYLGNMTLGAKERVTSDRRVSLFYRGCQRKEQECFCRFGERTVLFGKEKNRP